MSQLLSAPDGGSPGVSGIESITGNDGLPIFGAGIPVNVNLIGNTAQGVHVNRTAADTGTVTIDDMTTTQKGVTTLASNAETIAGTNTTKAITPDDLKAKLGVQTLHGLALGGGTTAAVAWLGEAPNGYLPIGSTGANPVLAPITSLDGSIIVTLGPGTIDLSKNAAEGTGQTVGAVTANILSIPLGAVAGTFQFEARVKGFESTGPAGCGYNVYATFTTDGATATLVGDQPIFNESPSLATADAYFVASGNNAVLQVLGVVGLTINWSGETEVT